MKKTLIALIITIVSSSSLWAAGESDMLVSADNLPQGMTIPYDSLLADWYAKNYLKYTDEEKMEDTFTEFSDSVYAERLWRIPSVMEMPYNQVVRQYIDLYTGKMRSKVSYMLGAMNFYVSIFEEALDAYGLPDELKYLPVIESALNPNAVSRAGASGLWQFMVKTGKIYGLQSNSLVDERRDPIKSTYAAARYLKDLYGIYGDWNLVIAAYNCGPGNVNKAINRAGANDYWEIYNYLPRETRGYVPSFIAANYVMNYYCAHNIVPMTAELPLATDTLLINKELHLGQVADFCQLDIDMLRALNPQYKKDILPGNSYECILRLPLEKVSMFVQHGDSIYAHKHDEFFKKRRYVAVKESSRSGSQASKKATYHKIRSGETLSTIARKYGVSVNNLKSWNNLKNSRINAGKRLRVSP